MDSSDHRAIGNRLDLFHQQEEGPGMVFWHPRGAALYRLLEDHVRRRMRGAGFREIVTPQLLSRSLWERSGHWQKFGPNMFAIEDGERTLALKPMSCPGHIQVFSRRVRSYRDLPVRYCEFGACHRNEPSGALQGLVRTRAFVQDDAHIFCREDQVEEEVARFCELLRSIYAEFGFPDFVVGFSTRPAERAGSDEVWDRAEAALAAAARAAGLSPRLQPGEGAFYGPKLEFILKDSQGREWQCGTVQLDFVLPERLDVEYVDADNRRRRPVMVHHAVFGSLERFIAILLEHHGGRLPFWLAPEQVAVAPVGRAQAGYARRVADALERDGLRVVLDDRQESLSRRIVHAREAAIPVFATVGEREERDGTVSLRRWDEAPAVVPLKEAATLFL
ncbi:MAG TPA: threonine--tRNA ligase [Falsiroseomonas sp.]|jgi:threonyl-tRNA synthetase|nr:threonine--tRNA ligase [Falsiroseomonas sp.]